MVCSLKMEELLRYISRIENVHYFFYHSFRDHGRPTKLFGAGDKVSHNGNGFFRFFKDKAIAMNNTGVFQFINVLGVIPTRRMLNSIEPRNTDQSHTSNYIYYSTEIKSKLVKNQRNRFTYLQYCKNICISMLCAVNKLSYGCKYVAYHLHCLLKNKGFSEVKS